MEKELRPGRRTSASLLGKISVVVLKTLAALVLIALLAVFVTSVSPIYDFAEPRPFSGPDIFNPYRDGGDSAFCWKRANFHTHTRVKGILNECAYWPDETDAAYRKFGYDIVTFSNHNELTVHPYDPLLQVNVYEHGYNLFKYHKLVFGCSDVNLFDHLVPLFASQKQFQLDLLGKESDFIQMNHPLRTIGTSEDHMRKLGGYRIMELDSGKSKENEYWDWPSVPGTTVSDWPTTTSIFPTGRAPSPSGATSCAAPRRVMRISGRRFSEGAITRCAYPTTAAGTGR